MKKYLLSLLLFVVPLVVCAEIDRFVFTTDKQTVKPSTLSGPITFQSQNNSGNQENVTETMDISFKSTSQTGQFLNSSGAEVSKTMSKNTANRTFYYKDSQTGEYTITITATGRESLKSFSASQKIVIGEGTTTNQSQSQTEQVAYSNPTTDQVSSHSSPAPLSSSKDTIDFEISAGRDRFSSVGSEIIFQATVTKLGGLSASNLSYSWSMGDGTKRDGNIISYRYKNPGEYNVVLNANFSDKSAVSRLKVLVIEPVLEVYPTESGIKITNNSSGEINLGDFVLESGIYRLVFPKDTIVSKSSSLVVPREIFNFQDGVVLKNPLQKILTISEKSKEIESEVKKISEVLTKATSTEQVKKESIQAFQKPPKTANTNEYKEIKTEEINIDSKIKQETNVYIAKPKDQNLAKFFNWFSGLFVSKKTKNLPD